MYIGAYLSFPPPLRCMHVMVHPNCLIGISVLPLRLEYQVIREFRVSPESSDTFHDVAVIEFRSLALCDNDASLEGRPAR